MLPPSSPTHPFLQIINWIASPLEYLETMRSRYGDIFTARWGGFAPFVMVSHPQGVQTLLSADPRLFESGSGNRILKPLLGENSLILLDGDRHQRQRQLVMPPFHGERMRTYGDLICKITSQELEKLPLDAPFKVRSLMQNITLRVILEAVFGLSEGERFSQLRSLLSEMLDSISSPLTSSILFFRSLQQNWGVWSPWGRFLHRQQQIDTLINQEIESRRKSPDSSRSDILSLLMSAVDTEGQSMTNQELRDELITLLVAGHETTASALTWALYWIHFLPDVQKKLLAELDTFHPDPNNINRLSFLNAVCLETLRIYPVALLTFPRIPKTSFSLMDYKVLPDVLIIGNIYLTHHDEKIYPNSKQFKPERFLEKQYSSFEFFPFGGSNRRCIGAAFAMYEMKLVLTTILQHYSLELTSKRPARPVRRGVTLAPPGSIEMVIKKK